MKDTNKHLFEFPEAYYALNSRSYLLMKFYLSKAPHLVIKNLILLNNANLP